MTAFDDRAEFDELSAPLEGRAIAAKPPEPDLRVAFVLAPHFTLLPFAGFIDALRHAADESDRSRQMYCRWTIVASDPAPIRSSCGARIAPFEPLPSPERFDYVVVVGGLLPRCLDLSNETFDFIRAAAESGVPIVALCTGGLILAKAGLMKGRRCAIHVRHRQDLVELFPDVVPVTDAPYVEDEGRFTCPGGIAAVDLAAEIITRHCGRARAVKGLYAALLESHDPPRGALWRLYKHKTYYNDLRVRQAIHMMEQNLGRPYPIKELATQLGVTARQLDRTFAAEVGQAPAAVWREIRLTHARWLLLNSSRTVTEIAYECGFSDCAHFTRWFRETFAETPSRFRQGRRQAAASHLKRSPWNAFTPSDRPDGPPASANAADS